MRNFLAILTLNSLILYSSLASAASTEAAERIALGKRLLEQGKFEVAIAEFQKAAAVDPKDGAVQLNLGYAYERAKRIDDAIAAYHRSIELEQNNFYARNNLGVLYDKQGKYDEAIAEFQNALKIYPNNVMAQKNLQTASKNKAVMQERELIIVRAEKAAETTPADPIPAYELARIYASYDKKETAMEWLGKAIQRGYKDFAQARVDPAFVSIRDEREFQMLLLRK
jgi:Flp pilus assembly protein TadD